MKIAHLILAHSGPQQLARLVRALSHADAYFFLHIDKKVSADEFQKLVSGDRIFFIDDRVKVEWGAYSIVQATINGMKAIVKSGIDIDHINLLSGADYPLKSAGAIHSFFENRRENNFMEFQLVVQDWTEAISRINSYHLTNYSFVGKYWVQKWMNRLLPARKMPNGLIAVGKSQWMSINMDATRYILNYLNQNPDVVFFFKHTWAPDEMIFQTILYNSHFRESMVNDNLRYTQWLKGNASPEILQEKDLNILLQSKALFARKFDMVRHPSILNQLDFFHSPEN